EGRASARGLRRPPGKRRSADGRPRTPRNGSRGWTVGGAGAGPESRGRALVPPPLPPTARRAYLVPNATQEAQEPRAGAASRGASAGPGGHVVQRVLLPSAVRR